MSVQMRVEIALYENGIISGILRSRYLEEPYEFSDLMKMIEKMEEIFDTQKFPQAFMTQRTFNSIKHGIKTHETERNDIMKDALKHNAHEEAAHSHCTFEITVKFRQNATWQGQILWAEKNQRQNFRSVLEMLKLMDEALTESGGDNNQIDWGDAN